MVAGRLQEKNGFYYIVLSYTDSAGKRRQPWIGTGLPVKGNKKRAEKMLAETRKSFTIPKGQVSELSSDMAFSDYMRYWLKMMRTTVTETTYSSYCFNVEKHIHYKNIRVEQAEQKLFDIKVLLCRYTEQLAKGEINDIYFDNIQVLNGDIPVSMIRGYQTPTEEVRVHDVHFDNITFMGNKCETWQDMRLVTELANDIYVNGARLCRQMKF